MGKKLETPDPQTATNGQVLTVDKAEPTGNKWATPSGGESYYIRAFVPSGETVTVPARCHVFVSEQYDVDAGGTLITDPDAKVVIWNG